MTFAKDKILAELREAVGRGLLDQADVLKALHAANEDIPRHQGVIEQARGQYTNDDVEIDDEPLISPGEKGCWVSAWVWVAVAECDDEDEEEQS